MDGMLDDGLCFEYSFDIGYCPGYRIMLWTLDTALNIGQCSGYCTRDIKW